jgi:tRNA pseudouridine38-40 synthase
VDEVPLEFHARYSALCREYSYLISLTPSAILRQYTWHVRYPLDLDLMRRAAEAITGEHDFQSFARSAACVQHHQCIVEEANWRLEDPLLRFTIRANRFLHGMVRALVGTMVNVGRGYTPEQEFLRIFTLRDRTKAGMSAPARGLTLERVFY